MAVTADVDGSVEAPACLKENCNSLGRNQAPCEEYAVAVSQWQAGVARYGIRNEHSSRNTVLGEVSYNGGRVGDCDVS